MLKDLMKRIDEIEKNGGLSVKIEPDENGYYDKECPVEHCMYEFKVKAEDWKQKFSNEAVYCPMCGHAGKSNTFFTSEQVSGARDRVRTVIIAEMRNAIRSEFQSCNQKLNKSGWIKISVKGGQNTVPLIIPIEAKETFEQELVCQHCSAQYSVIGSAFFCPCCGHNCVDATLDNSLRKIETKINHVPAIKSMVAGESKDEAEILGRSIIESCLNDCVVAFQRFCEESYKKIADPNEKVKFNAFQSLEIGGSYWVAKYGESYRSWLLECEYNRMNVLFNRRHLLSHTEGIVDGMYVQKTNDDTYKPGQRIIVHSEDIEELLNYIRKIVGVIRKKLNER